MHGEKYPLHHKKDYIVNKYTKQQADQLVINHWLDVGLVRLMFVLFGLIVAIMILETFTKDHDSWMYWFDKIFIIFGWSGISVFVLEFFYVLKIKRKSL